MPIEVKMPRLSDTMEQGTVVKWAVKPGQKVRSGDVIADIETDKATMELQTFDDGTVAQLTVPEGESVKVGTVIMRLAEAGESVEQVATGDGSGQGDKGQASGGGGRSGDARRASDAGAEAARGAKNAATGSSQAESPQGPPVGTKAAVSGEQRVQDRRAGAGASGRGPTPHQGDGHRAPTQQRIFASPLARKMAEEAGVDLGEIQGSGPSGRIIRRDVEAALAGGGPGRQPERAAGQARGPAPLPMAGAELPSRTITLSNMRGTIARRLVQSKTTIPHYQVTVSVRMDALLNLRQQLNEQLASQGIKLSVNDFLVRACALAMHQHPHINARWNDAGPGGQPTIDLLGEVNIGVAIALPLNERGEGGGLVVATIRGADRAGLRHISLESKRLSEKARSKGLTIEEMSDSTFTISNLGMFGVEHFTAIINPPNAAILAVGAATEEPVVEVDPRSGEKRLGIGHVMRMTMSSDHRLIDGAMAAAYLQTVKDLLEKPASLLV